MASCASATLTPQGSRTAWIARTCAVTPSASVVVRAAGAEGPAVLAQGRGAALTAWLRARPALQALGLGLARPDAARRLYDLVTEIAR